MEAVEPEAVVEPELEPEVSAGEAPEVTPEPVVSPEVISDVANELEVVVETEIITELEQKVLEVTPETVISPIVVISSDVGTSDSSSEVIDFPNEEIGIDSQSQELFVTDDLIGEVVDPLTGLNFVASQSIQKTLWSANFTKDSVGFKGVSGDGDFIFKVSDSNDRRSADMLTGSSYGLVLVETGTSFEEAMESNDYIISNPFSTDNGKKSFVSMDSDAVGSFIDSTDSDSYTSMLVNSDTM